MSKIDRLYELDALRGLAALSVILFHYTTKFGEIFNTQLTTLHELEYGFYGVHLFFIISGFVIFMTINKVKTSKEFIYKRFIRLYPIFWVCMVLTYLITQIVPPGFERSNLDLLMNFTMIPSLIGFKSIDGVYWSLIPELLFYSMIVILLYFNKINKIITIGFIWLSIILLNKIINFHGAIQVLLNLEYGTLFLLGINFYTIYCRRDNVYNHLQIFLCFIIAGIGEAYIFPIILSMFVLCFYAFSYSKLSFIKLKPLIFLGEISYSLYLIHQFIGYSIQYNLIKLGVSNFYILVLTPLIFSIILSYILTQLIEKPIVKNLNLLYNIKIKDQVDIEVKVPKPQKEYSEEINSNKFLHSKM